MKEIKEISKLANIINQYNNIVFLGGAGVSTESGILDFRSNPNDYLNKENKFRSEKVLSHNYFYNQPELFYKYYKERIIFLNAKPNAGHYFLTKLEKANKLKAIITQNVDNLHLQSGSKNVLELHGSIMTNHCVKCNHLFNLDYIVNHEGVIRCSECNGMVKPDVVLYGEPLNPKILANAYQAVINSDLLMIVGTSLNVYPAADLIKYANKKLLINLTKSAKDVYCDFAFYGKFGETAEQLSKILFN